MVQLQDIEAQAATARKVLLHCCFQGWGWEDHYMKIWIVFSSFHVLVRVPLRLCFALQWAARASERTWRKACLLCLGILHRKELAQEAFLPLLALVRYTKVEYILVVNALSSAFEIYFRHIRIETMLSGIAPILHRLYMGFPKVSWKFCPGYSRQNWTIRC